MEKTSKIMEDIKNIGDDVSYVHFISQGKCQKYGVMPRTLDTHKAFGAAAE